MPDIDKLMEEWEPEFEELLKTTPLTRREPKKHACRVREDRSAACSTCRSTTFDPCKVYLEFTETAFQQQTDRPQVYELALHETTSNSLGEG